MPRLIAIARYPVKSLGDHSLARAAVEGCGLVGDRRWMVIDARGRFVTRREAPAMATIDVAPDGDGLLLSHPDLGECCVAPPDERATATAATIWRDTVEVRLAASTAADFLSAALGREVRLAYQHAADSRPVDRRFGRPGDHVSLADGYPLLVTTTASLAALNRRLAVPIGMERFRPNLVIDGTAPWAEDGWRTLRIGAVVLRVAKPCSRCVITTQHPLTGARAEGDEPLATLRAMGRARAGGIMFSANVIPDALGTIAVGDRVEAVDRPIERGGLRSRAHGIA